MKSESVEKVTLEVEGLRLAAEVYYPVGQGPHPALIICHGIPARRTPDPADPGYPLLAKRFRDEGFLVLIFNFRGSGESEGNFDMLGWTRDLGVAIDYLCQLDEVDKSRLSVMGFSGGAATSVYCAARDKRVSSLVICACPARFFDIAGFSRIEEFVENCRQVGIIRDAGFPSSLEEWAEGFEETNPLKWIHNVSPRPILIIHGDADETVSLSSAWEIYKEAGEPKDISIVKGAEHRLRQNEPAMNIALAWLKKVNGLPEGI